jgi:hypothetical protein
MNLTKAIILAGEAGAWLAMFYALPVMFYFIVLVEPSSAANAATGMVVPIEFDGLFYPYEGLYYVTQLQWWLYRSALIVGPMGAALWLISRIVRLAGAAKNS